MVRDSELGERWVLNVAPRTGSIARREWQAEGVAGEGVVL